MALSINIPDSPFASFEVPLGGQTYNFDITYNTRDSRYRLDIYQNSEVIILGLKLVENADLLGKYNLPAFNHGGLFVVSNYKTDEPVGRDNIGTGKAYELIYVSNEELNS
jgi:hypothetical protein